MQLDMFEEYPVFRKVGNDWYCRCFVSRRQRWYYGTGPGDDCGAYHGDCRCSWTCFREGDSSVMEARLRRRLWAARSRARQAERASAQLGT